VGEIYARVAARYGSRARAEDLQAYFYEAWLERDALGAGTAGPLTEKIERDWWRALVAAVFERAGGVSDFEAFFAELYDLFARAECWRLFPEVPEVLAELKGRGVRLGVVSNWDSRLPKILEGLGIAGYFDFVLASAHVGAAKPAARIFEEALARAGVAGAEAVHIGDSCEDDVHGARRAGLHAVWLDRADGGWPRHAVEGVHRVQSLRALL
jgi:putative hydrolase of the HAD superfamily